MKARALVVVVSLLVAAVLAWSFAGLRTEAPEPGGRTDAEAGRAAAPAARSGDAAVPATEAERNDAAAAHADGLHAEGAGTDAAASPDCVLTVTARVVDGGGRPIPGATLTVEDLLEPVTAIADADGHVRMVLDWPQPLARGNRWFLSLAITAEARTRVLRRERLQRSDLEVPLGDVVLEDGGDIVGQVQHADGRPAVGARVAAIGAVQPTTGLPEQQRRVFGIGLPPHPSGASAVTDEDGRYRLRGLPLGVVGVRAFASGHLCDYTAPIDVRGGAVVEAPALRLAPFAPQNRIAGRVLDHTGSPVPGAIVRMHENRGDRDATLTGATAAQDGSFELGGAIGQRYTLEALLHRPEQRSVTVHDVASGRTDVELRFAERRRVELVVLGPDGTAADGVTVMFLDDKQRFRGRLELVEEDGRTFAWLPDGTFSLQFGATGCRHAMRGPFEPAAFPARYEVRLEAANALTGVVLAAGVPVVGADVHLHLIDPETPMYQFVPGLRSRLASAVLAARTDENGRFTLVVDGTRSWVVHAQADGFGRAEFGPVEVVEGRATPPLRLELPATGAIAGHVLVGEGASREGLVVAATRGDGHCEVEVTDADGAFLFEWLTPGGYQVRLAAADRAEWLRQGRTLSLRGVHELPVDVEVVAGQRVAFDVDAREHTAARLLGAIAIDGLPTAGWRITVGSGQSFQHAQSDTNGRFEVRLPEGEVLLHASVRASNGGMLVVERSCRLVAGDNEVELASATGGLTLTGLQASEAPPQHAPAEGYVLQWRPVDGVRFTYRFDPGADGAHACPALPVGEAELRRRPEEPQPEPMWPVVGAARVVAGQVTTVRAHGK